MLPGRQKELTDFVLIFILANIFLRVHKTCCFSSEPSKNSSPGMDPSKRKAAPPSSKIIDGVRAGDHEFPYIVSVRLAKYPQYPFGMGSILGGPGSTSGGSRWIITCRHLPGDIRYKLKKPKVNTPKLVVFPKYNTNWKKLDKHRKYKVKRAYCHPWPKSQKYPDDDIALLELEDEIPLNKPKHNFKSIQLVDKDFHISPEMRITAAGWGLNQTKPTPQIPDHLMKADIYVVETSMCQKFYQQFPERLWFCAAFYKNRKTKGVCNGDSGGPCVVEDSSGEHRLAGVISGNDEPCT